MGVCFNKNSLHFTQGLLNTRPLEVEHCAGVPCPLIPPPTFNQPLDSLILLQGDDEHEGKDMIIVHMPTF